MLASSPSSLGGAGVLVCLQSASAVVCPLPRSGLGETISMRYQEARSDQEGAIYKPRVVFAPRRALVEFGVERGIRSVRSNHAVADVRVQQVLQLVTHDLDRTG